MGRFFLSIVLILTVFFEHPLFVLAVTGTSYEIDSENGTVSTHHDLSGTTYELEGVIEPIAGKTVSTNYRLESGSAFAGYCGDGFIDPGEDCDIGSYGEVSNGATCETLGFEGGSLSCASNCTFDSSACYQNSEPNSDASYPGDRSFPRAPKSPPEIFNLPEAIDGVITLPFTFDEYVFLSGRRFGEEQVTINNNSSIARYYADGVWIARVRLVIGLNTIRIQSKNDDGLSEPIDLLITRRMRGDTNGDGRVDDVDLSRLSRRFKSDDREADFNSDGIVNDYDLSILAARFTN